MGNRFGGPMILIVALAVVAIFSLAQRLTAGQAPGYRLARTADDRPNLTGVWQALTTANWDIETHAARPAQAVVRGPLPSSEIPAAPALGARGGVPGGIGVVEGEEESAAGTGTYWLSM